MTELFLELETSNQKFNEKVKKTVFSIAAVKNILSNMYCAYLFYKYAAPVHILALQV